MNLASGLVKLHMAPFAVLVGIMLSGLASSISAREPNWVGLFNDLEGPPWESKATVVAHPKPQDCAFGDWGHWSRCSKLCSGGIRTRVRVLTPPHYGGKACNARDGGQTQPCNTHVPCAHSPTPAKRQVKAAVVSTNIVVNGFGERAFSKVKHALPRALVRFISVNTRSHELPPRAVFIARQWSRTLVDLGFGVSGVAKRVKTGAVHQALRAAIADALGTNVAYVVDPEVTRSAAAKSMLVKLSVACDTAAERKRIHDQLQILVADHEPLQTALRTRFGNTAVSLGCSAGSWCEVAGDLTVVPGVSNEAMHMLVDIFTSSHQIAANVTTAIDALATEASPRISFTDMLREELHASSTAQPQPAWALATATATQRAAAVAFESAHVRYAYAGQTNAAPSVTAAGQAHSPQTAIWSRCLHTTCRVTTSTLHGMTGEAKQARVVRVAHPGNGAFAHSPDHGGAHKCHVRSKTGECVCLCARPQASSVQVAHDVNMLLSQLRGGN